MASGIGTLSEKIGDTSQTGLDLISKNIFVHFTENGPLSPSKNNKYKLIHKSITRPVPCTTGCK